MTPGAGYHHPTANMGVVDPALPIRFPTRMFSGSSSSNFMPPIPPPPPPPQQPVQPSQPYNNLYSSPNRPMPFSSHYPPHHDYYVGHVLGTSTNTNNNITSSVSSQYCHPNLYAPDQSNYTCIGAPVGHGFGPGGTGGGGGTELEEPGGSGGGGRDGSSLH